MKRLYFILLSLILGVNLFGQGYTEKYNSVYKQYEYHDSRGNLVGVKKWNPVYKRWEYTDYTSSSTGSMYDNKDIFLKSEQKIIAPYDVDRLYQIAEAKQRAYNYNKARLQKTFDVFMDCLRAKGENLGGYTQEELKVINKYIKQIQDASCGDLSNENLVQNIEVFMLNVVKEVDKWQ